MAWKKLALDYDLTTHTSNVSNPHSVTKTQVGLGNCDNTSDLNKPVSTATTAAIAAAVSGLTGDFKADGTVAMTGNLNFAQHQAKAMVLEVRATAPSSPVTGQIYFNSADGSVYVNV